MELHSFKEVIDDLILESERNNALDYFFDINYEISTLLVNYRIDHDMTQKQLAEILGISQAMVSKYENGDYNFTLKQICEICDKLDIEIEVKLKEKEQSS